MSTPRIVPTNAALGARIEGLDRTEIAKEARAERGGDKMPDFKDSKAL